MNPTDITIYIGGLHASHTPSLVRTTLGSCIAVCLYDPAARIGGMNHFMLPDSTGAVTEPGRYGNYAMELLIGALQRAGAARSRFCAKVFGGGHVLDTEERSDSVPARNIAFAEDYLRDEGITTISSDVGGLLPRLIKFETWSGRAFVRRLARPTATLMAEETRAVSRVQAPLPTSLDFF